MNREHGSDLGCSLDFSETEGETLWAVGMTLVTTVRIDSGGISVATQSANLNRFWVWVHD
jgi:hypothetical protein